jgi:hypothetical protein
MESEPPVLDHLVELVGVFAAGVTLQLQPLTWVVVTAIVALALVNWMFNTWRAGRSKRLAPPSDNAVTYIGGGRWTRRGIGGLDVRWPMLRLTVGRDSLYYGPNQRWPLARFHPIPGWQIAASDVAAVSCGHSAVHVKLKDGQDLVFLPVFIRPKAIVEALAARGYPADSR